MVAQGVVIVIPVYKREVSKTEQLSLTRCISVLGDYPIALVAPASLDCACYLSFCPRIGVERFPDDYFTSLEAYSSLLLNEEFYARFSDFQYLLIHQLDAFVFTNHLEYWCGRGYDYIGAPWQDRSGEWGGVGNGGLSLRRVAGCLQVLRSECREGVVRYWQFTRRQKAGFAGSLLRCLRFLLEASAGKNRVNHFLEKFMAKGFPEDTFWGIHSTRFCESFRVAPSSEALHFAIEAGLEESMPQYSLGPPFGCHREWYLASLYRYMFTMSAPSDSIDRAVWKLAEAAGICRGEENAGPADGGRRT